MNKELDKSLLMGKNINEKSHGNYKGNLHVTFFRSKPVIPHILFSSLLAIPIREIFCFTVTSLSERLNRTL